MQDTQDVMAGIKNGSGAALRNGDSNSARRTIVYEILDSKLPPQDKAFQRVFEDVTSVSGAGFETTGSTLRVICFHVFSNPRILRHLREELKSAEAKCPDDVLLVKVLEKLPYLTATIMEGLRLSPGVATRQARIAPDRDLSYGKYRIPAGTPVGMTTILMHTDEELYPEPLSFKPERWINDKGGKRSPEEMPLYAPFSRGTRVCLGMQ